METDALRTHPVRDHTLPALCVKFSSSFSSKITRDAKSQIHLDKCHFEHVEFATAHRDDGGDVIPVDEVYVEIMVHRERVVVNVVHTNLSELPPPTLLQPKPANSERVPSNHGSSVPPRAR